MAGSVRGNKGARGVGEKDRVFQGVGLGMAEHCKGGYHILLVKIDEKKLRKSAK